MEIKYQIHKEYNLLVQKFYGKWSINDFNQLMQKLVKEPDWQYVNKTLTDLREVNIQEALDDLQKAVEIRNQNIKQDNFNVYLVDKPMSTAVIHLYINEFHDKIKSDSQNKYCSSVDAAIEQLNLKISVGDLEKMIQNI